MDVTVLKAHRAARQAQVALRDLSVAEQREKILKEQLIVLREAPQTEGEPDIQARLDELDGSLLELRDEITLRRLRLDEAYREVGRIGQSASEVLQKLETDNEVATSAASTKSEQVDRVLEITASWIQRLSDAKEFFPAMLAEAQVVAGTCLGFIGIPGTREISYDLAIIEEASRALPTEVLVPASRAKRVIFVGDGKQLPPFLESELLKEDWLEANGLVEQEVKETLFDRLTAHLPRPAVAELKIQYRMHPAIGDLVQSIFYPNSLQSAPNAGSKAVSLIQLGYERNVMLVSTSRETDRSEQPANPGYTNRCEVRVVRSLLQDILKRSRKGRKEKLKVVLLTPYSAQREALEQAVASLKNDYKHAEILIHSVHMFQGHEADIAIFSSVRANGDGDLGFTNDRRLLNVALSRGQGGLVVVGDAHFLGRTPQSAAYRDFVTYVIGNPKTCQLLEAHHVG
ncbi:MAG: DEAD/DEAH box helicase [Rudaea sp.]